MALTMLIGIQLARYLGPTNYGIYGLVMALVSVASVAAQFGLPQLAVREAAAAISARPQAGPGTVILWFAAVATLLGLFVSSLLVGAFLLRPPRGPTGQVEILLYAGVAIFLFSILSSMVGLMRGLGRNLEGQAVELLLRPALIVAGLFAVSLSSGGLSVGQALSVQVVVALLALAWVTVKLARHISHRPKQENYAPEHWKAAATSLLLTAILLAINANYPLLVASPFVSAADLGVFRVALSCAALIALPASIANISLGPIVARLYRDGDRAQLAHNVAHTTVSAFGVTALGLLIVAVAGRPLIIFLFGPQYAEAHVPLMILGAAQLIVAAFGITGTYLNLTGRERLVVKAFMISVPLGLGISVPLAAKFGISGAAFGNFVMVSLWHAYVFRVYRRHIDAPLSLASAWRYLRTERLQPPTISGIEP